MDLQEKRGSAGDTTVGMSLQELRQRAVVALQQSGNPLPETIGTMSPEAFHHALHELRVHQIELEMQNEELRRTRDELDTSRERYFDLYYLAPVGYCTVSQSGLIEQANLAAATLLGMGRAGLVQQEITRFITPNDQDVFYFLRQKIMRTSEVQDCELRMVKQDGAQIWVHLQAIATGDLEGGPCMRIVLTNITERKQAEQALLRSKKQYDDLVSKIPFGTYILSSKQDGSFALIYASPRAAELFNAGVENLRADPLAWTKAIHPDDRDVFLTLNQKGIAQLRPFLWSGRVQSQGHVKFLRIESVPEAQEDGEVHWHGIVEDITERKRTEQLLQDSEALLKAIIENEPECVKIVDAQGLLVQMNPAGLAMIEVDSLEQVKGAPVLEIVAPEYRNAYMDLHKRVIAGGTAKLEYEMTGLKGGRRWVETHAVPLKVHGETVHLAVTRDITQHKQFNEQVRQLAFHDSLTNLPNRRMLLDRLNQAMAASRRSGCYCALLFLDLDNFKPLNDAHGHEAGDLLLIEVARRLTSSVRGIDTVSRFGGDEFAVLLSELLADKAQSTKEVGIIAEKIRVKLAEPYSLAIRHADNTVTTVEHRCSASIGAVLFINHECSQEDILRQADAAMYQAKDDGRNTVAFHEAHEEV